MGLTWGRRGAGARNRTADLRITSASTLDIATCGNRTSTLVSRLFEAVRAGSLTAGRRVCCFLRASSARRGRVHGAADDRAYPAHEQRAHSGLGVAVPIGPPGSDQSDEPAQDAQQPLLP